MQRVYLAITFLCVTGLGFSALVVLNKMIGG